MPRAVPGPLMAGMGRKLPLSGRAAHGQPLPFECPLMAGFDPFLPLNPRSLVRACVPLSLGSRASPKLQNTWIT